MKTRLLWLACGIVLSSAIGYWSLPRAFPAILGCLHPEITFRLPAKTKTIFLTIDDSPSTATPEILAVLAKYQVTATFFIIGSRVHSEQQLVQIVGSGCTLGHHMWTTHACSSLSLNQFKADFEATQAVLGRFGPTYFRPPSDFGTKEQLGFVQSRAYRPILGTIFPFDPWTQNPALLAFLVKWLAVPGGIFIMHDGNQRGLVTAKVLDEVIPALRKCGYDLRLLPPKLSNQARMAQF